MRTLFSAVAIASLIGFATPAAADFAPGGSVLLAVQTARSFGRKKVQEVGHQCGNVLGVLPQRLKGHKLSGQYKWFSRSTTVMTTRRSTYCRRRSRRCAPAPEWN